MNEFQRKPLDTPKLKGHRFTRDELQVLHGYEQSDIHETTLAVAAYASTHPDEETGSTSDTFFELMAYLALPTDDASLRPLLAMLKARA